jgi:hypothetical protein
MGEKGFEDLRKATDQPYLDNDTCEALQKDIELQ